MIAIEWCGIIARIYSVSVTVVWLRTSQSANANTNAAMPRMIKFLVRSLYMTQMKASMTIIIDAPMTNAIQKRVSLQKTWSMLSVFKYISQQIIAEPVTDMAMKAKDKPKPPTQKRLV